MSTELEQAQALVAFHTERAKLLEEYEAAKLTRDTDRPRWAEAKQKYAEWRTALKQMAVAAGTRKEGFGVVAKMGPAPDEES